MIYFHGYHGNKPSWNITSDRYSGNIPTSRLELHPQVLHPARPVSCGPCRQICRITRLTKVEACHWRDPRAKFQATPRYLDFRALKFLLMNGRYSHPTIIRMVGSFQTEKLHFQDVYQDFTNSYLSGGLLFIGPYQYGGMTWYITIISALQPVGF